MRTVLISLMALCLGASASMFCQEQSKNKSEMKTDIKELQAFHNVLHPLVHDALQKGDYGKIRLGIARLLKKADAIQKAKLPARLSGRKQEFQDKSMRLHDLLTEIVVMKDKVDDVMLEKMINQVHETFEELVEIAK